MSSSFEKSVKGGTKVKLAPPKSKYVEHILQATQSGEAGVAEVFRTLIHRLRDSTWTVAFKSLIIVHLMIKEGVTDVTLSYLSVAPKSRLAINTFADVQTQGQNIRRYSEYLLARAEAYAAAKCDYVRSGDGRIKRLSVDKGLLRETEIVQNQIKALVRCDLLSNDVENEITLTAFRLLTRDLLDLYNVLNEAVMNVLSHYFEMSKSDAERAIKIYKRFCSQTDQVVQYLGVARQYEHATRLEIPKIKHAPTSLANSLQEYLDDTDFDLHRRQYLAEQEAKRTGKPIPKPTRSTSLPTTTSAPSQAKAAELPTSSQPPKGPAPDLIDFFESIEQNQQPMAQSVPQFQQQPTGFQQQQQPFGYQQQAPQQTAFMPAELANGTNPFLQRQQQQQQQQQYTGFMPAELPATNGTNPFLQQQQQQQQMQTHPQTLQTQFTGAGFGGYGPQPQQQFVPGNAFGMDQPFGSPMQTGSPAQMQSPQQVQPQQQMQSQPTNPFRQSTMPTGGASPMGFNAAANALPQRQNTNPFVRSTGTPPVAGNVFAQQAQPMQSQPTGTNPFARNLTPSQQQPTPPTSPPNALQMQPTGSTNPFRQSNFVNQQTGTGWQNAQQATMGGLESLETIPVFPRPGQTTGQ